MEAAVMSQSKKVGLDKILVIQRCFRNFLARKRFQHNLLKLVLFKMLIEHKIRCERVIVYKAFARLLESDP